jgi:tetratricopeptide (TPR) repeat protein
MQDYENSRAKLETAMLNAEDSRDLGLTTMNLGMLYKRQKDFITALRHYCKALCFLDKGDLKTKSIVYNNMAEVYKILGQYYKALKYIGKAFDCINDDDLSRLFVCFNTYTEIKILMGERESVLDEFLALLERTDDLHLYKGLIVDGINNMIEVGSEDESILKKLEKALLELIEANDSCNAEYVNELHGCLDNIRLCLEELKY